MDDAWWIQHIFSQSLAAKANPEDAGFAAKVPRPEALSLVTRLFSNCGALLKPFTDRQVGEGLVFLGASGESGWMFHLYDPAVDWTIRRDCIRSIGSVYRDCFAVRCRNAVDGSRGTNELDGVCFMWWDRFPSGGIPETSDADRIAVYDELIKVMADALRIEHVACQQSALRGLGHFGWRETRACEAIDQWLLEHPTSELRSYAQAAREGNVM